ncbi:PREDICTED: carnitine O-acetyltransferase-like [Branchiostoma belcheri]|uniref:Carnitine O-acetyltransferase n=1 Tax=Branchiostoma belcheri TaxID=7741 RepID=A0A6P5A382_BRABE|nr:PREDICTED: carnitine O-acetyltransferase-like [Branchiostoma belcheri]
MAFTVTTRSRSYSNDAEDSVFDSAASPEDCTTMKQELVQKPRRHRRFVRQHSYSPYEVKEKTLAHHHQWKAPEFFRGARLPPGRIVAHQSSLPPLPVPDLSQTLQKYLKVVRPLVDDNAFQKTKQLVEEFGKPGGLGESLQAKLQRRAQERQNWLDDWWLHTAYLDNRLPVVIHVNPGIVCPPQDFNGKTEQLQFAAKLVAGVLDYKVQIDNQSVPIDTARTQPLCMDQYYKLFCACRLPGEQRDQVVVYGPDCDIRPRHIVVAHNNQFFSLDVYDNNWKPLSADLIHAQLQRVVCQSKHPSVPVGILTTGDRDTWGRVYKALRKDKANKLCLEAVNRSIFMLCLDQETARGQDRWTSMGHQLMHGGGSQQNSGNRWFDKTLQFTVGTDGAVGIVYEHSPAEGPPIIALLDHMLDYCSEAPAVKETSVQPKEPERLVFSLNDSLLEAIDNAKRNLDMRVQDLDLHLVRFKTYGKNFPKSQRLSPDSYIQIAMQLAYYRVYRVACATYESGSTRMFHLGRTDTIQSASVESLEFCTAMQDSSVHPSEKVALLRRAVEGHKKYAQETVSGQGIDRHLLGLKLIAVEAGLDVPDLFVDSTYEQAVHFKLSTSQVPSKYDSLLCFGPVVPDGYGVCYNPAKDHLNFCISAFNSSLETDTQKLADALHQSLVDMQELLQTQAKL